MRQSTDFGSTGTMMVGAVMALLAAAMMVWGSSDATADVVLFFGMNQPIPEDLSKLRYGVSVTDACIDWDTTEEIISAAHDALRPVLC